MVEKFSVECSDLLTNVVVLQTGLVPIVETLLDWHEMTISLFFCGAGIWVRCEA